jgi:phosphatidylserine/phosphatidylglycerophosphate/cardiolipin synthase-like enzyme
MLSVRRTVLMSLLATCIPLGTAGAAPAAVGAKSSLPPLLVEPNDGFGAVYSFIVDARKSVDVEMYELNDQTVEEDLVSDERRGVAVRVLLDRAYAGASYNTAAFGYLTSHGVPVRWGPTSTTVHEKSVVVDGVTALIATFNLGDTSDYYATTRDFGVFDSNASDVHAISDVFNADWSGAAISEPPAPDDGADLVWSPGSEPVLAALIASARKTLLVESEEMDDTSIVSDLEAAARRGVNVEVVMTADPSWTRAFDDLERAGVHVATYSYDATPYIHAKVMVADAGAPGQQMFIGSENFSVSSLEYNRELGVTTKSAILIAPAARTVRSDFAGATPWRG